MKNRNLILSLLATLALIGCGGGSSDSGDNSFGSNDNSGSGDIDHSVRYSAYVPLMDNPTTFECSKESMQFMTCCKTIIEGSLYIGTYDDRNACEVNATAWINDFNHEDAPQTQEQSDALVWINYIRKGTGLPVFHYNAKLEQATFNHENYLEHTHNLYGVNMAHDENNETYPSEFYTGVEPIDRATAEGYEGYSVGEILSFSDSPLASMKSLSTGIYHRQGMLSTSRNEIGIGGVQDTYDDGYFNSNPTLMGGKDEVYFFLNAISPTIVFYPFDGQVDVETTFRNNEIPDPLPNNNAHVGNPISVSFNTDNPYFDSVEMLSFKLFEDDINVEVSNITYMDKDTDPNNRFSRFDFALFPMDVLKTSTSYRVEINYILNGEELSKSWVFETRG